MQELSIFAPASVSHGVLPQISSCFLGSKESSRHRGYRRNGCRLDPFSCSSPSNSPPCIYTQGSPASLPWMPPLLPVRSSEVLEPPHFFGLFSHCLPQVKTVPELNQNIKVTNNFRLVFQYHHWP